MLKSFPEVESVFGKAGRADTSTDPAPLSMMETTVILKPQDQWRAKARWYSGWLPDFLQPLVRPIWPDHLSWDELVAEMDRALRIPGVTNAWTMPIKARIDMLTTGVRTPVGIKIFGPDLGELERIGTQIEAVLPAVDGHAQRLRRAGGRRLLRRHRAAPRRAGAPGPDHRRPAGRDHDRHRRRERRRP